MCLSVMPVVDIYKAILVEQYKSRMDIYPFGLACLLANVFLTRFCVCYQNLRGRKLVKYALLGFYNTEAFGLANDVQRMAATAKGRLGNFGNEFRSAYDSIRHGSAITNQQSA